ncbi:MAG: succinate dehydrogenase, hydrophobic membrane anchor protein [Xanthomonadales bacterium]|nr:succinate dehydrogenase, hydrophobic membrane anchor protein [Xanthomonadales bacterium]
MSGTIDHWWMQRVTSLVLIPLSLWFLWAGASLAGADHATALAFMQHPVNVLAAVLLTATGLYHAQAGILTIVEDYVPGNAFPKFLMLITRLGCGLGVLAVLGLAVKLLFGA